MDGAGHFSTAHTLADGLQRDPVLTPAGSASGGFSLNSRQIRGGVLGITVVAFGFGLAVGIAAAGGC